MELNRTILRTSSPPPIRFRAVGDVNFGRGLGKTLQQQPDFSPLPSIHATLGKAPLGFFNLECNPVVNPTLFQDVSTMIAPAAFLDQLRAEFNVANIANNHIMDARETAFADTLQQLHARRFHVVGGGLNLPEAEALRICEVAGLRCGFLACADFVYGPHRTGNHARLKKPGVAIYAPRKLIKQIKQARPQVDILICSLHTGLEFHRYPDPVLMRDAHQMIAAGAQIILIHHAHVRQGIELYRHGLIAYGLGNFMFDLKSPYQQQAGTAVEIGLILDIFLDRQGVCGYEFWLSQIMPDGKTRILADVAKEPALYQDQLTLNHNLSNPGLISREWQQVCRKYLKNFYYALDGAVKEKNYQRLGYLLWDLSRRENRRWLMGLGSSLWKTNVLNAWRGKD